MFIQINNSLQARLEKLEAEKTKLIAENVAKKQREREALEASAKLAAEQGDYKAQLEIERKRRFNEALAYVTVEPGVTQQQLSDHLREHGYRLWMDCTGAGPDTSLMGNILERGFGHSAYGNRFAHTAGMRIVHDGLNYDILWVPPYDRSGKRHHGKRHHRHKP